MSKFITLTGWKTESAVCCCLGKKQIRAVDRVCRVVCSVHSFLFSSFILSIMKFRIKFHAQVFDVTLPDRQEISTLADLKTHLRNEIPAVRKARVSLSLNGKDPLDESQTLSQSGLVNGDTIYLLDELIRSQSSMSVLEQPLTLDEVRDCQVYPILIDRLLEATQPDNDFDYMVIVLHALMLESGFQMVIFQEWVSHRHESIVFYRMLITTTIWRARENPRRSMSFVIDINCVNKNVCDVHWRSWEQMPWLPSTVRLHWDFNIRSWSLSF